MRPVVFRRPGRSPRSARSLRPVHSLRSARPLRRWVMLAGFLGVAGAAGPAVAMAQEGPETALILPPDTDQLRFLNSSRIQRELRVAADSILPGERPRSASVVQLILEPQGRVHEARLIYSSGSTRMDAEAVRIGRLFRFSRFTDPPRPRWVRYEVPFDWLALRR